MKIVMQICPAVTKLPLFFFFFYISICVGGEHEGFKCTWQPAEVLSMIHINLQILITSDG